MLCALRRSGLCLEFAAPELRADRHVVLQAVQQQGEALEFASRELREDPVAWKSEVDIRYDVRYILVVCY